MANITVSGARWVRSKVGPNLEPIRDYPVASAYGTAIYSGDLVKRVSDGTIAAAAAGDAVFGIAKSVVRYKNAAGQIVAGNVLPASITYSGAVDTDNWQASCVKVTLLAGQEFEMDVDTVVADRSAAQSLVGNNFDIVATAGSSTTGRSGYVVNNASGMGTGTAQIRMTEIGKDPLNDVTAVNWKAIFEVNETTEPPIGTATGV